MQKYTHRIYINTSIYIYIYLKGVSKGLSAFDLWEQYNISGFDEEKHAGMQVVRRIINRFSPFEQPEDSERGE